MTFQLGADGVDIYERVIVPLWFEHWAEALMRLAKLKPGNTVLDVACGTGVVTRLAKKIVGPNGGVSGLDMNASMISRVKSLAKDLDIRWIESDVFASGLGEAQYDVILSQQGYQYFPDKQRALDELYRLLSPEGRLIFLYGTVKAFTPKQYAMLLRNIFQLRPPIYSVVNGKHPLQRISRAG